MSVFEERKKRPKGITGDSPYLPENSRKEKPQRNFRVHDGDTDEKLESGSAGFQPRRFNIKKKPLEEY